MKKWLMVGGGFLLLAWGPFLYAELTSDPAERKGRDLPSEQRREDHATTAVEIEEDEGNAGKGAEAVPEPAPGVAEPGKPEQEPAADPAKAAPAPPAADPTVVAAQEEEPTPEGIEGEGEETEHDEPAPPPATAGPVAVLRQAFDSQPRDALWASEAERRISSLFGGDEVPREMLKTAACRRAVCKVEVAWSQERATAYLSLEQAAREAFGSELGVELVGTPDETEQQVNLYLSRKGYTLADLSR